MTHRPAREPRRGRHHLAGVRQPPVDSADNRKSPARGDTNPNAKGNPMKWYSAAITISAVMMTGCGGGKLDDDPTNFGITPALRAVMRELVAETDPAADPDQVVKAYMEKLKKSFDAIKPNAAGDYVLPADQQPKLDEWLGSKGCEVKPIIDEFAMEMPKWTDPLVSECESGNITPERKELLLRVLYLELTAQLSK